MKKKLVFAAALLSVLLLVPVALADVYVPPGPPCPFLGSMDAWIIAPGHNFLGMGYMPFYLWVMDMQDEMPVGWYYTDGPWWDPIAWDGGLTIHKSEPWVWNANRVDIPWSTEVMILGFIPGVVVSPDQVPPPVELVITWNGIPYVVTLTLPEDRIVGYDYPPELYPDIQVPYPFAYPNTTQYKWAYYNIWVGDMVDLMTKWGEEFPPEWYEIVYGMYNGLFFWYRFHPNVGDWIAWNCEGQTKFPPTYDITALFEYSTSQIWFPHVCFDVSLLEVHKMVQWIEDADKFRDVVTIENVGKGNATGLDFMQTFPYETPSHETLGHGVIPDFASARATLISPIPGRSITKPVLLPGFWDEYPEPYVFQGPFSYLMPGEIITLWLDLDVENYDYWSGTIVFDSMVSANEIPPWKYPIALHSIELGEPWYVGDHVPLWVGWKLYYDSPWYFDLVEEWYVWTPILRDVLTHPPPVMTLDPVPVDLNGDGLINDQDVSLVRQAIVGLIAYDHRMDINVNNEIDTQDLAAYKLAAGG